MDKFTKHDGDKLRLDLVTPSFGSRILALECAFTSSYDIQQLLNVKEAMYNYRSKPNVDIHTMLQIVGSAYDSIVHVEEAVAAVLTFGAKKYTPNNWQKCEDKGRYIAALGRHLNAMLKDDTFDEESGLPHMDHVLCNLMFLEWFDDQDK